jgi:hypothetical protein
VSESDITLRPDSGGVWPAMKQPRGHIGQQFAAHRFAVEPAIVALLEIHAVATGHQGPHRAPGLAGARFTECLRRAIVPER